jgi:hypothetical protein
VTRLVFILLERDINRKIYVVIPLVKFSEFLKNGTVDVTGETVIRLHPC